MVLDRQININSRSDKPSALNDSVIKLLGRKWVKEILVALRDSQYGLTYSQLHYDVAKTNKTRELLDSLESEGLVTQKNKLHYITDEGHQVLELVESILTLPTKG